MEGILLKGKSLVVRKNTENEWQNLRQSAGNSVGLNLNLTSMCPCIVRIF
jgi:hypothetical protein